MVPNKHSPEEGGDGAEDVTANNDSSLPRPASKDGYLWECPICGLVRKNTMSEEGRNALRALKTHVYLTGGDGHGDAGTYPDEGMEAELPRYLRPVDGR